MILHRCCCLLLGLAPFSLGSAWADVAALPGNGFPVAHYETLWAKSPFAIATPDAAPESTDYALVGIAEFDGIPYASLIDKKSQEHFLVSGDKPARGLTLTSVTPGKNGSDTFATIQQNGQPLILKLETVAASPALNNPASFVPTLPQTPLPGVTYIGSPIGRDAPPRAFFFRRPVRVPPPPSLQGRNVPGFNPGPAP